MSERTAYLEVASADGNVFTNAKFEDFLMYTDTSDQAMHIGNWRSNVAAMTIRNNLVYFASNVNVAGNISIGGNTSNMAAVVLELNTTDALKIPKGTTLQRPTPPQQGHIRYNTDINTYEGFGAGNAWGSLGGVKDTNQDTYISAESYPTSNDDILRFYNSNNETLRVMPNGRIGVSNQAPSERLEVSGGNVKMNSNLYVMSRLAVAGSNPTEAADVTGNLKVSSNIYAMNYLGVGASNTNITSNLSLEVFGNAKMNSNLEVVGNLSVRGTTTTVESTVVNIADNIIRVNNGAAYNSSMQAGMEINRGTGYSNYFLVFDEPSQYFKIGQTGSVQAVATRDDSIPVNAVSVYDLTNRKFTGCNTFVYSNNSLGVGTESPSEMVDVSKNVKVNSNIYAMSRLGVASSNPTESLDVTGNTKISQNLYAINRLGVANSNPSEALDILGNAKISSNFYTMSRIGVANSNPTEALDVLGNTKISQNLYAINRLGVANSNPTEALDVLGNAKISSNIYTMSRIGAANSNPTEALDVLGNAKISSNFYTMSRIGVANSNPTEALDVLGNTKISQNLYAINRLGVANSNPTEALDVLGNAKISQNLYNLAKHSVGHSNPTEALDILGNTKISQNLYALNRIGIATSNPQVSLEINATDAILLPKGTTLQRPAVPVQGHVRYNADVNTFEGFGAGNAWGSLGGVKDTNQDTYISAESFPTSNDDILRFYTSNNEVMRVMPTGRIGISNQAPSERLEVSGGNVKANSNVYVMSRLAVAGSNPTEAVDVLGNLKVSSNIYAMNYLGVGTSNTNITSNLSLEVFGNAKMNSNLEVVGTLTVRGTTTTVDSTTVNIVDNIIRVNNGAAYNSSMQAGIEINRGTGYSNYYLVFDETSQYFKVGQTGSVQAVATRDDTIPVNAVSVYDLTNKKFTGCNAFVYSNNALGVGTASPSEMLDVSKNIKANSNMYAMSRLGVASSNPTEALDVLGNTKISQNLYTLNRIGIATSNPQVALEINATDAILLPKGTTLQRPAVPVQGHVRYNADINTFEGYGAGNAWGSLGGVKDTNQDTYISAESFPTSNDDILRFYNSNNENMRIMPTGRIGISNQAPSERLELSGGNAKLNSNLYVLQNLSVGKSNPAYPLDVYGNAAVDGSVTTTKFVLSRGIQVKKRNADYFSATTLPSGVVMGFSNDTLGVNITMQSNTPANYFRFIASNNEVLRITGNGYIGVNTQTPSEFLHVQGNVYATNQHLGNSNDSAIIPSFSFKEDSNTGIFHASQDAIGFTTNGTEKMRITSIGNVGIGNSNPVYPLDVTGNINASSNVYVGTRLGVGNTSPAYPLDVTGNINASSNVYVGTKLGVGNTAPAYPLDVTGNINCSGNISAGNLGMFRNRIINGDMRINQRGAISAITGSSVYTIDRWFYDYVGNSTATITQDLSTFPQGFYGSLKTVFVAATNGNYGGIYQYIEGYNLIDFSWGTSSGSSAILSFWVNMSITGIMPISIDYYGSTTTVSYYTTFNVITANQWQYVTISIPSAPSSAGVFSSSSLSNKIAAVRFMHTTSGNVNGSVSTNTWSSTINANNSSSLNLGSVSWTRYLTGIQFEKGTIATPFEFRPYAIELQLCQRYYNQIKIASTFQYQRIGVGVTISSSAAHFMIPLSVPMRDPSTIVLSYSNLTHFGIWNGVWVNTLTAIIFSSATLDNGPNEINIQTSQTGAAGAGSFYFFLSQNAAGWLAVSNEL